jgi:hypothetical protein
MPINLRGIATCKAEGIERVVDTGSIKRCAFLRGWLAIKVVQIECPLRLLLSLFRFCLWRCFQGGFFLGEKSVFLGLLTGCFFLLGCLCFSVLMMLSALIDGKRWGKR